MTRYSNEIIETTDELSGKSYFTSGLPTSYIPSAGDFLYTAQVGDRWDLLASRFYGSSRYWYAIARANRGANGSLFITPGFKVIIPERV